MRFWHEFLLVKELRGREDGADVESAGDVEFEGDLDELIGRKELICPTDCRSSFARVGRIKNFVEWGCFDEFEIGNLDWDGIEMDYFGIG